MPAELRVLVLTPDYPPARGGIQLLMDRLVRHWESVDARVVTLAGPDPPDDGEPPNVYRVRPPRPMGHVARVGVLNARAIHRACRRRPDVVLSGHIVMGPAALAIRRATGVPFAQYVYSEEVAHRPRLARLVAGGAGAVVAISRHAETLVRACGAPAERIHRIPPGVDLPVPRGGPRSASPLVATVSTQQFRYKGHDVLLRAFPLIRSKVPDVRWAVVGDGPLRPLHERWAGCLGVGEAVQFLGAVDDAVRDRLLGDAHVFAMPSRLSPNGGGEGFGVAYLEAAAHGLPVVAGDVGGAPDAVVDGITGVLTDPTDHVGVADAITRLLLDGERAAAMGRAGALHARAFAWPEVARRVRTVLEEVAA
jgi:phosphatidylinositol alpha-1,6-mannosyltransferase